MTKIELEVTVNDQLGIWRCVAQVEKQGFHARAIAIANSEVQATQWATEQALILANAQMHRQRRCEEDFWKDAM